MAIDLVNIVQKRCKMMEHVQMNSWTYRNDGHGDGHDVRCTHQLPDGNGDELQLVSLG